MKSRIGENHITNEGYEVEIIEYFNASNCTIKFKDSNILKNISFDNLKMGRVKNPFKLSVYGVGFIGVGLYKPTIKGDRKCYEIWKNMLKRCYYEAYESYKYVTVHTDWHNFQNFAGWFYTISNYKTDLELDKDILIKGSKEYSPETCCFVPQEVNKILIKCENTKPPYIVEKGLFLSSISIKGVKTFLGYHKTQKEALLSYKKAKEEQIKSVANEFKNSLNTRIYEALINYKIN